MIVAIPTGSFHGWGIAGTHLAREICRLSPVEGVTLHCMKNPDFEPTSPELWNRHNIGYCFFENDIDAYRFAFRAGQRYDHIVAGSSWCEHHLRIAGVTRTSTILQGIEPEYFRIAPPRDDDGRFIVFSGGKFELRKSQDVVIAAMKVMMERHRDVWLSCSWHNMWPFSIATMAASPLIRFEMPPDGADLYRNVLHDNGIDLERVILNPLTPNNAMLSIYRQSDIGLFANRCEGGNNMVMCEYMACGRGVVAAGWTGHADVISDGNAYRLTAFTPRIVANNGQPSAVWFDPELDEVIEKLEYAYRHRDQLPGLGERAAASMERLSWPQAARAFHGIAAAVADPSVPVSPQTLRLRGVSLLELGDIGAAERQLTEALRLDPLSGETYMLLGMLHKAANRTELAEYCRGKARLLGWGGEESSSGVRTT